MEAAFWEPQLILGLTPRLSRGVLVNPPTPRLLHVVTATSEQQGSSLSGSDVGEGRRPVAPSP